MSGRSEAFGKVPPALYRAVHVGNPGDEDFYASQCAGAEAALELACGWGRISERVIPRVDIFVGLDLDPEMIEEARQIDDARARWVVGDMADFELHRRFDRILIPYNSFYNLLEVERARSCLLAARRHLERGGRLIMDAYHVDEELMAELEAEAHDEAWAWLDDVEWAGQVVEVFERSEYRVGARRIDAHYRYHIHRGDGTIEVAEARLGHRFWPPEEIEELMVECGLEVVSMQGDFEGAELASESGQMVVVARRA